MQCKHLLQIAGTLTLLCGASASMAQTLKVSGQITGPDGFPIAEVTVSAGGASTASNAGGIYEIEFDDAGAARVQIDYTKAGYADTFGVLTSPAAPPVNTDLDGDGVEDDVDDCPASDTAGTVIIGSSNTGVTNTIQSDGCSVTDQILQCSDFAEDKYQYLTDYFSERHWHYLGWLKQIRHNIFESCSWNSLRILGSDDVIEERGNLRKIMRAVRYARLPLEHPTLPDTPVTPPVEVTLDKTMITAGETQLLNPAVGGTLKEQGFAVTFPAGSLNTTDPAPVEIVITPIDVSTPEIGAFPGDFQALTLSNDPATLETFALMDVELLQNGQPVNLANGATAAVEFLLPASTALTLGETVPLWYYDTQQSIWVEDGSATVIESSTIAGRLAAIGNVSHFTWWNVDRPITEQTSVSGRVVDNAGNPLAGISVYADGVNYIGISNAQTDSNGEYCINVKLASEIRIRASLISGDVSLTNSLTGIMTTSENIRCQDGGSSQVLSDLVLQGLACVDGIVLDSQNSPIAGALVQSLHGGTATTDAIGHYCLSAPANTATKVYSPDNSGLVDVTTGAESDCATGNCVTAPDLVPSLQAQTTCITGQFQLDDSIIDITTPITIAATLGTGIPLGAPDSAVSGGNFCLDDIPQQIIGMALTYRSTNPVSPLISCFATGSNGFAIDSGASSGNCANTTSCINVGTATAFCTQSNF